MQKIHKSKEPWKKKEPGARLSQKARRMKKLNELQRLQMDQRATQQIKIFCNKTSLFLPPGLFKSFTVKVKIPLRADEFSERMRKAFPELEWVDS